jgi:cyclopropane-fatty-acyl-phospholipid synthase
MTRHIFPNSHIPSSLELVRSLQGRFVVEDWHNFGTDYDRTLLAWESNFRSGWEAIEGRYGECFYRMWRYYLLSCAGSFRARYNQLWQIVLSKRGLAGGYVSVR